MENDFKKPNKNFNDIFDNNYALEKENNQNPYILNSNKSYKNFYSLNSSSVKNFQILTMSPIDPLFLCKSRDKLISFSPLPIDSPYRNLGNIQKTPMRFNSNFECKRFFCDDKDEYKRPIQNISNISCGQINSFFGSAFTYHEENLLPKLNPRNKQCSSFFMDSQQEEKETSAFKQIKENKKSDIPVNRCSCKKTQCNKLYCECYANGKFCDGCQCINCKNQAPINKEKEFPMKNKANVINNPNMNQSQEFKGCTCTKSNCSKLYCECHKSGKKCSSLCRCVNCLNHKESEKFSSLQLEHFDVCVVNNIIYSSFNETQEEISENESPKKKDNVLFTNKKRERIDDDNISLLKTEEKTEKKNQLSLSEAKPKNLIKRFKCFK